MDLTPKLRKAVRERDNGVCLRCGALGTNVQHRIGRGMGGTKTQALLSELVTLCGSGTTGCHGWATQNPEAAYESGWAIRRSDSRPASEIPLIDVYGGETLLDDDGTVTYLTSPWSAA